MFIGFLMTLVIGGLIIAAFLKILSMVIQYAVREGVLEAYLTIQKINKEHEESK